MPHLDRTDKWVGTVVDHAYPTHNHMETYTNHTDRTTDAIDTICPDVRNVESVNATLDGCFSGLPQVFVCKDGSKCAKRVSYSRIG